MFVINPDAYSLPAYRIGPFTTRDLRLNHLLDNKTDIKESIINDYFQNRFGSDYSITINGREAISLALDSYNLKKDDLITILTTSQNFYISSCVTKEIEKFCQWNREIVAETKLIFVNHELGYIYPDMDYLVSKGLPIIEDCCTIFFSENLNKKVGKYGDFAVYSFPKFFPIQIGGLLVNNTKRPLQSSSLVNLKTKHYIQKVLSHYNGQLDDLLQKRKELFDYGIKRFSRLGFTEQFERDKHTVPSAMMLNNNGIIKDLTAFKTNLWDNGIQSSIFYGEDAFFIPSHQNLTKTDVNYFFEVIKSFIKSQL